ncbi:tRNA (guanosine(46)-N7)-methyltransferase TrmB [Pokkaliibacter plantistimulans]|uniref:tRNA (guanine-N(7)-)-methyltransferase n=1 Tax=Proteobacteria bacterium 228 TaxID=2083153 RepID=A0A2S5KIJ2_9PROT|nr:tRNA (guanosine(46)-N7)-methyltransferase TrmB [Pokkaliibacter plantistimulans]PPC74455.1 tRNA (guanosine(46)-N7)-methyltransferase TrmB [Pokkaliibacter plantistimulans]
MTDEQQSDLPAEPQRHMREVRSFVKRVGRRTPSQERALEQHFAVYGLRLDNGLINPADIYGREAPLVVEIGFGMGDSMVAMAAAMPDKNFLGIEVHEPGVGRLLNNVSLQGLSNVRVYCDDAVKVLADCLADASIDTLQLFFPDPWPKKKHHKRRIVQPDFVEKLRSKLKLGGVFHMATDWQPYAEHMMEVMTMAPGYSNVQGVGEYSPQPEWRPVTKFQRRGENLGHGVWDLMFERTE